MADKKNNSHYISAKESRRIAKENIRITKQFEKRKKRKNVEAEYLSQMKDEKKCHFSLFLFAFLMFPVYSPE